MKNLPAPDRELLIPILIGGLSVIGILVVLLIGRARNAPVEITMTPSATQFRYIYLGTEPAVTTLEVEGSELPVTGEPIFEDPPTEEPGIPVFNTPTRPIATAIILTLPNTTNVATTASTSLISTPSRTATSSTASAANTYDDTDSRLSYSGSWVSQTGLNGAYQGTLHISYAIGSSVTFTFVGQEVHLYYQSGSSLGSLAITFDADPAAFTLNQAPGGGEWVHVLDTWGTHEINIEHLNGGSVNIDRFMIPVPPTSTPTLTRTPTP